MMINGYLRSDGRKGIRNNIVVTYLVECAHHVAREIVHPFREQGVNLIGFSGCQSPRLLRLPLKVVSMPVFSTD